jgi:pimeloyl-ACP methyl ester carboxylesterase
VIDGKDYCFILTQSSNIIEPENKGALCISFSLCSTFGISIMMQSQFFDFERVKLHYTRLGNGNKNLLMFHGFGQNHGAFKVLEDLLLNEFTIYSFDIFFHGKSLWNKGEEALEKPFWKALLWEFLVQHNIERFSLLGFSMGGKFVLASLEAFPEKVEHVLLLAPDGIRTNFLYSLATYPTIFRSLFKSMINHPKRLKFVETLAVRTGLIDKGILRFVDLQMDTLEKRNRVYHAWVVFRHLKFDMKAIAKIINSHQIKLTLMVGKYDKIITAKNMDHLLKRLDYYTLEILETGHNGVVQESAKVLGKFSF